MKISAYIPCFNNRETLAAAIVGIQEQTRRVDELFVIDDGSTDGSAEVCKSLGVRVIQQPGNLGRGAARARAMEEAANELVLCCDATNSLAADFVEKAVAWFDDPRVAGVFGRITQPAAGNAVHRWRGRHLFRMNASSTVSQTGSLATYGAIVRKSGVIEVGSYDKRLRHTEDADLGRRLLDGGYKVVFDPSLEAVSVTQNSLWQVMERYSRWYGRTGRRVTWDIYLKQVWFSLKVMAWADLRDGDLAAVPISLLSPHFQFWISSLHDRN